MSKVAAIAAREYTERVRSKWFIIATVFGPFLLAAMMIIPTWMSIRTRGTADLANTVIVDATGTQLGKRVAEKLATGPARQRRVPQVRVVQPSDVSAAETTLTQAVMREERNGYIVLDAQTVKGEGARYAGRSASSLPDMDRLEDAVRASVLTARLEDAGVDRERAKDLTFVPLRLSTERITDRGRGGSGAVSFIFGFAIAIVLYMSLILYGQGIMRGVMEEKQTRVAEVVISSVRPDWLLAGKVLGVTAVWLTQVAVWIATALVIARVRGPILAAMGAPAIPMRLPPISIEYALLLAFFILFGFVLYAALFAATGSMVNSDQEAQQAAQPLMMLVIFSFIFVQPVIFNPTGKLAVWMSLVPFSSPFIMPIRLTAISVPWTQIAASIALLLATGAAGVWLAARIYRVGLLMYGKKPTLRELGRWIRYAG